MTGKVPSPILPRVPFRACPIRASLGTLGRKWALLIVRDVGLRQISRFNELVKANPGLTPRALSLLLTDLQREGMILRSVGSASSGRRVRYSLTRKGRDVLPVVAALIEFGMRHYSDRVFEDGRPRDLGEVFPGEQATLIGPLLPFARGAARGVPSRTR
ncbi:MAG: winged helix-turn-helix transcriptional regulator [Thermoplasmata archaeon]